MVEWSGPAKRDLKQIYDYIAQSCFYPSNPCDPWLKNFLFV